MTSVSDQPWVLPVSLSGTHAKLVPLSLEHHSDLVESCTDGELWKLWYTFIPQPDGVIDNINMRLALQAKGSMVPFSVVDARAGKVIGMTTYMNIDAVNRRLEIGSTWYRQSAQRTPINTECKLMLLTHAFEKLDCVAVEFRTSSFNFQSRAAIERLGAKLDGVLRNHMLMRGGILRDTYVYSIIQSEWPAVKANLEFKLQHPNRARPE